MNQESLLFGLAAVFAGVATVEFVLAFVYTPALLAVALPFAAAAYFVWYQASGRLRERAQQGRADAYRGVDVGLGGFGAGPRESDADRRGGFGDEGRAGFAGRGERDFDGERGRGFGPGGRTGFGARERRRAAGARATGARSGGARGVQRDDDPSPAEAYRLLGLEPDADADAVRRAYREAVKSVHPDREGGDEDEFKRVNEAYEVLRGRS